MFARVFIPLVVAAGVLAQIPALPQCVVDCSTQAAASTDCVTFTNATCVCASPSFQAAAGACLMANCTAAETQTALDTQTAICGALASGSTTAPPSTDASTTTSAPAATTSGAPSIPACVSQCASAAAASTECVSFTNASCVCSSADFQAAAGACLTKNCSASDLQQGLALQQSICSAFSSAGSQSTTASSPTSTGTGAASSVTASFGVAGLGAMFALLLAL